MEFKPNPSTRPTENPFLSVPSTQSVSHPKAAGRHPIIQFFLSCAPQPHTMPFWNKIKDWFSGNDKRKTLPTKPSSDEIRSTFTRDFFSILFKNKDKHITTMLNSISLSSNMKILYLIDNGRAIAYDLTVDEGVLVGLLGKQLVVATAVAPPPPIEVEDLPEDGGRHPSRAEKFTFKAGKDSQFTLTYNEENQTLGIIGFDDLDTSIEAPDEDNCKEQRFEMKGDKVVRLLYKKEVLEILNERV